MSIWNKVLLGLNILVSFGVFYFALQTLKIHKVWRESAQKFEKKLKQVDEQNVILKNGPDGKGGVRAMEIKLAAEYAGRGRVWYTCDPYEIENPGDVSPLTRVKILQPNPHGVETSQIVYVFDCIAEDEPADSPENAGEDVASTALPKIKSASFLGEFDVDIAVQKAVKLKPSKPFTTEKMHQFTSIVNQIISERSQEKEKEKATGKKVPPKRFWVIWEQMPTEGMADDLENGGKDRPSHDYYAAMKWHERILDEQSFTEQTLRRRSAELQEVLKNIEEQSTLAKTFNDELLQKKLDMEDEKKKVETYVQSLSDEYKVLKKQFDVLMNENRALAQSLEQFEEEAITQINSRTASSK